MVKGGGWSDLAGIGLGLATFLLGGKDRESWKNSALFPGREAVVESKSPVAAIQEE